MEKEKRRERNKPLFRELLHSPYRSTWKNRRDTIRAFVSSPPFFIYHNYFFRFFPLLYRFRLCFVAPIFYKTIITSLRPIQGDSFYILDVRKERLCPFSRDTRRSTFKRPIELLINIIEWRAKLWKYISMHTYISANGRGLFYYFLWFLPVVRFDIFPSLNRSSLNILFHVSSSF